MLPESRFLQVLMLIAILIMYTLFAVGFTMAGVGYMMDGRVGRGVASILFGFLPLSPLLISRFF